MSVDNNSTNSTGSTALSFCFSCGFNFGHIADGIEDTTMGMILVGIVLLVVMLSSCLSCYLFYNCNNGNGKGSSGEQEEEDEERQELTSKKKRKKART